MARFPNDALALELARAASLNAFAGLGHAAQFARDLRSALEWLAKHRSILASRMSMELQEAGSEAALVISHPLDPVARGRATECGMALLWRVVTELLGIPECLERVELEHDEQGTPEAYQSFFGTPVIFRHHRNALVFKRDKLASPTSQANLQLFAFAEEYYAGVLRRIDAETDTTDMARLREGDRRECGAGGVHGGRRGGESGAQLRGAQRLTAQHGQSLSRMIDAVRAASAKEFLSDRGVANRDRRVDGWLLRRPSIPTGLPKMDRCFALRVPQRRLGLNGARVARSVPRDVSCPLAPRAVSLKDTVEPMTEGTTKDEITTAVDGARERFETMRTTLAEKAAVLGAEVKETVDGHLKSIEEGLNKAKADIEQGTDEARLQAALGAMEARDRWQALETELFNHVQKAKAEGQETFDKLKMQAEVDRANAEAAMAARKEEAKKWFSESVDSGEKALSELAEKLKTTVNESLEKLKSL